MAVYLMPNRKGSSEFSKLRYAVPPGRRWGVGGGYGDWFGVLRRCTLRPHHLALKQGRLSLYR